MFRSWPHDGALINGLTNVAEAGLECRAAGVEQCERLLAVEAVHLGEREAEPDRMHDRGQLAPHPFEDRGGSGIRLRAGGALGPNALAIDARPRR